MVRWARAIGRVGATSGVRLRALAARLAFGVAIGGVGLIPAAPASAEVEVSEVARELFREGVAHLKAAPPRYAEAYEAFKRAHEDSPSPKILGNLGYAATMLERDGEAIAAYRRYLTEVGAKSDREARQIKADLEALEARVSRLELTPTPSRVTVIDERLLDDGGVVENRYELDGATELGLRAGEHRLTITAQGYEVLEVTLSLAPGESASRELALVSLAAEVPPPDPNVVPDASAEEDGIGAGVWIALGATGALAIATGVVGGLAASNHGAFEEAQAAGDPAEAARLRDRGGDLNVAGDVLLGTTLAAGALTAVLLIVELTRDDGDDEESEVVATPLVGPEGVFFGVKARF